MTQPSPSIESQDALGFDIDIVPEIASTTGLRPGAVFAALRDHFPTPAKPPRKPRKPTRGASRFRQRDVARALRAAKAIGGGHVEIDPVSGKLSVIPDKPDAQASVLDEWLAKRAKHAH